MALVINVPASEEQWDPKKREFVPGTKETKLILEHSLRSISKWEETHEVPFLGDGSDKYNKTPEEFLDYFKCMTIVPKGSERPSDDVYNSLTKENIEEIIQYINSSRTATTINYPGKKDQSKKEIVTSEVIYSWMILLEIPPEYDRWFLNRLLTLIEVTSIKKDPDPKKMKPHEYSAWRKAQNAKRRAKFKK